MDVDPPRCATAGPLPGGAGSGRTVDGPTFQFSLEGRPIHPAVPEVRRALTAWQLRVEGPPPTPEFVASALHAGWRTWHTSPIQRTEVGGLLPTLIHRAQTAARLHEGDARRQSLANLAEVYHLAQAYLAWNGERELLWLTVDRGMIAAQGADDPLAIAWSVFYAAHLLRAVGRWQEAAGSCRRGRAGASAAAGWWHRSRGHVGVAAPVCSADQSTRR